MDHKRQGKHDMTLDALLDNCTDPQSPLWEQSWNEFLEKYKNFIYKLVLIRCKNWNNQRFKYQLSDEVNDIVQIIIRQLIRDDFRFLKQFKNRDNEQLFLYYLSTLANRITKKHLLRHFSRFENLGDDLHSDIETISPEAEWELYEELVQNIRSKFVKKHRNIERNIHLFLMYTWTDMTPEMITHQPFYKKLGPGTIYTLINRIRSKILV